MPAQFYGLFRTEMCNSNTHRSITKTQQTHGHTIYSEKTVDSHNPQLTENKAHFMDILELKCVTFTHEDPYWIQD